MRVYTRQSKGCLVFDGGQIVQAGRGDIVDGADALRLHDFSTRAQLDSIQGSPSSETDEIVIADGPAAYFDNTTGEAVADCSYWYCLKHNRECNLQCPVRAWVCRGEPQWK
jgi:hypothetical protein